ncbi:MAG: PepSY domain-containing protein [Thermoguttaceae bacterium]|nr:PepSY domain-containing protein [Thermoguttaceae bacterium]
MKRRVDAVLARKAWRQIHYTLGWICSAVCAIVCVTGGLYLFRDELGRAVEPERYYVEARAERMPLDALVEALEREWNAKAETVVIPADSRRAVRALLRRENERGMTRILCDADPYTGKITGAGADKSTPFFKAVRRWHTRLNLPKDIGRPLVDVCSFAMLILLLTGLRLWLPQKISGLKARLTVKWNGGAKRALFDLHNAVGIYTSVPLVILSATGAYFAFGEVHSDFAPRLALADAQDASAKPLEEQSLDALARFCLDDANGRAFKASFPRNPKTQALSVEVTGGGFWSCAAPTVYYWNAEDYTLVKKTGFRDMTPRGKLRALVRECHMGGIFGTGSKIIFCLGCLGGFALALTGLWLAVLKSGAGTSKQKDSGANA